MAGDRDAIFEWNGTGFIASRGNTNQILRGVWGRGSNEVYAFGDAGRIRRLNGSTWSLHPPEPSLRSSP